MNRIGLLLLLSVAAAFAQPAPPRPPREPLSPAERLVLEMASPASFLGVGVAEIGEERAKELKLKEERGVEVKSVSADSPASKAGVAIGDIVLEYNGQHVEGTEQFVRLVRETPVGRQVKLLISRNGSSQTLTPTIGSRSSFSSANMKQLEESMKRDFDLALREMPSVTMSLRSRSMGIDTESLSSQLAEYFGVKEGVLVRSVTRGSAAEKAGIKAGDVITKVGDRRVARPNEITNALRSQSSTTFPITLVRSQKEMTVNVTVESRSGGVKRSTARMDVKTL